MLSRATFLKWFQDHVQSRWTKCEFTSVQLDDWYWRLKQLDETVLTKAVRRHFVCDEPRRPSLKKICEYVRQMQAKHAHTSAGLAPHSEPSGVPEAHTYIQCVGKDNNGHGPVGWFVPILLWPFHQEYTQAMYDKTAEQQLQMHRRSRGGIWEVATDTTHSQMRIRQWQLTGQWERVQQHARKDTG